LNRLSKLNKNKCFPIIFNNNNNNTRIRDAYNLDGHDKRKVCIFRVEIDNLVDYINTRSINFINDKEKDESLTKSINNQWIILETILLQYYNVKFIKVMILRLKNFKENKINNKGKRMNRYYLLC